MVTMGLLQGTETASAAEPKAAVVDARTAQDGDPSDEVLSEGEARAKAKRTGEPVEVASLRGESSEVFATPEGDLEAREYLRPVWTRVDGTWQRVDTELTKSANGTVAPKAITVGLEFSGGGDDPLVRMRKAGRELALSWPSKLPAPRVSGATATYADVLPGVDLRMGAQEDGFTQLLVVKSAKSAASSALKELRLKLKADGMDVREVAGGALEAVDKGAKRAVFEAPQPLMWDSSPGEDTESNEVGGDASQTRAAATTTASDTDGTTDAGEPGAGESGKLAPVDVELPAPGDELVLKPEQKLLTGEDTEYPVFIDPQWYSPRASAWSMASKYWASSPQWKFNGKSDAGLGYCGWAYCKPYDTKRLFYRIPTSKFADRTILSAEFVVRNVHSASCTKREVQLWRTKGISDKTTWNSQSASGFWIKKLATKSFAHGYTGCAAKDAEFNVKSAVQEAANGKWSTMTFGLKATSETDKYTWKRFSDKAFLRVKYNRPPQQVKMSQLMMEYGGVCKRPADKARVRTLGKIYANNVTDPDGDSVRVQFRAKWDSGDGKGSIVRWKPAMTSAKKSGSNFALSLPSSIPANKTVHWYVRSYDGAQYSPWSYAGDPTGCYFVYDTSVPKGPAVSSGEYPASDPEDPDDPWYDGVGQYGTFDLNSASADVNRYRYGVNTDPRAKNQITTSGGAARSANVLPGKPGLNFVTAQAFDEAGNGSEIRTYQFRVRAGQPERATWQLDEAAGATEARGSTPARTATLHGGATPGAAGKKGTALHLDGTSGYAATDVPVVNTNRGFTVSAWVKLDEKPDSAAIAVAQPGNHRPGFELYYSAYFDRWVFNQYESDSPDAKVVRAMADAPGGVKVGEWTHLVGSYNGVDKYLQLYVDDELVGQTDLPSAWNARRGLQIGAGSYDGQPDAFFPGAIDDLQIFDKRIVASEVTKLYEHQRVGDPGRPTTAVFDLDEQADATEVEGHGGVLPARFHGGVTPGQPGVAGKAAKFNGSDGYAKIGQTSGPHVNTSRSFTISAWAKLDRKPSGPAVIVAQEGRERPGFQLYYSAYYDRWIFNQWAGDSTEAEIIRAMQPSGTVAHAKEWVHLTGVHDTVADTLTLYVNGRLAGSTKLGGAFYASQSMFIGATSHSGQVKQHFPGSIDDVRLFDRPVSAEEARQLFQQRPLVKGRWKFDEAGDGTTGTSPDASAWDNEMDLRGGAEIGFEGAFMGDGGLVLNGSDAYAATTTVPVDTSTSFTVSAWAQAAAIPEEGVSLLSAAGSEQSAFDIRFVPDAEDPEGLGHWELAMPDRDGSAPAVARVRNSEFFDVRDWTHLTVVYDGFAKQARLYVDGRLQQVSCADAEGDGSADETGCTDQLSWGENVLTFKAGASLQVGRAKADGAWGQYFPGSVDDVWTFQGALNDDQVEALTGAWFDPPTEVPQG
ncbi:LamG-like jellyroll fold domain-containing protein [Streptomyces xinghaiensis]|uniref:LamG-like jellyroll fold domain-containing protein n=1 Tax=Streptomyces xinghaiensis TaxID=1038928 RepID=UPI003799D59E